MENENSNLPPVNQRIRDLVDSMYRGSVRAFSIALGLNDSQKINRLFNIDTRNGKYPTPSIDVLMIISNVLDISLQWLQTGEGDMYKPSIEQTINGNNNTSVAGNSNNVNSFSTLEKAIVEIAEMRKLVQKRDEQRDRLITLLEKK